MVGCLLCGWEVALGRLHEHAGSGGQAAQVLGRPAGGLRGAGQSQGEEIVPPDAATGPLQLHH